MNPKIVILGGGISAISTAIAFRLHGYDVEVVSERFMWEGGTDPYFASLYPAASIIPHSVGGHTAKLFMTSREVFEGIAERHPRVVRHQKHLEIYEQGYEHKAYFDWMNADYCSIDHPLWGITPPCRKEKDLIEGVGFDMLFVEMSAYVRAMKSAISRLQINIVHTCIDQAFIDACLQEQGTVCNCLGRHRAFVDNDSSPAFGMAGILLRCPVPNLLKHALTDSPVSYNYVFERGEVYAYPREMDIVLGGTRIPVDDQQDLLPQLQAHFTNQQIPFHTINGLPVPDDLLRVNKEICHQLYGVEINTHEGLAVLGVRPFRQDGVRLDIDQKGKALWINNYGYGGAGVTLSWGGAVQALTLAGVDPDVREISTII